MKFRCDYIVASLYGNRSIYRRVHIRTLHITSIERFSEALLANRGAVKMLIFSEIVHFLSNSLHQVLQVLALKTVSTKGFPDYMTGYILCSQ